jgi:Zn-dependent protease with chaperone function
MWTAFLLSLLSLVVFKNVGLNNALVASIKTLCVVLVIPCYVTVQYFYDSVEKISKEYCVTIDDAIMVRINTLEKHLGVGVKIGYFPSEEINAFAISSVFGNKALIAFSTKLLEKANDTQLRSIAAHEIAHLKNGDSRNKSFILAFTHAVQIYPYLLSELSKNLLKTIAISVAIVCAIATAIVFIFPELNGSFKEIPSAFKPFLAFVIWPAVMVFAYFILNNILRRAFYAYSREREYNADLKGAEITSYKDMICALSLLEAGGGGDISVFDTHPPLRERRIRLEAEMARIHKEGNNAHA